MVLLYFMSCLQTQKGPLGLFPIPNLPLPKLPLPTLPFPNPLGNLLPGLNKVRGSTSN